MKFEMELAEHLIVNDSLCRYRSAFVWILILFYVCNSCRSIEKGREINGFTTNESVSN